MASADGVDDEHVDRGRRGREGPLGVAGEQGAIETEGEADARGGRAAHRLDEAVVAATAAHCVLRGVEGGGGELEGGSAVVVEAADEPGRDREGDAEVPQARLHLGEVGGGLVGEEVRHVRRGRHERGVLGALGVEDPQRVAGQGLAGRLGQGVEVRREVGPHRLGVPGPVAGIAERVEQQRHLREPQALVEAPRQGDHLDVDHRVLDPEHLDAHLVELPVAALLRLLVAEVRPGVPDLPRRDRPVLHVRPDHRGRLLGAQRDASTATVLEVVHLLGDHVGRLADAVEHLDVLEHRGDHLAVARRLDHLGEQAREAAPPSRVGGEDVAGALGGSVFRAFGHEGQGYRPDPASPGPGCRRRGPPPGPRVGGA